MKSKQGITTLFILVLTGFSSVILFALASVMSGFGTRWGLWDFRTGLSILKWSVYGEAAAVFAALACCIMTWRRKTRNLFIISVIALTVGIACISVPLKWFHTARGVPPIHDISTDTENPPQFDMILKLREGAPNSADYGGPEISSQQHAAYPDIRPADLAVPPARAFEICLGVAREMGWEIVDADMDKGIIEATDTTFWFGFRDDIVIRIAPYDKGSRVDLRSVSRVGKSDVGTNAKRIRAFLKRLG